MLASLALAGTHRSTPPRSPGRRLLRLAAAGWLAERRGRHRQLALPYYFCLVSAAGIAGIYRFLPFGAQSVWAPAGRRVTERAA